MSLSYAAPLTGQAGILHWYDWIRRRYGTLSATQLAEMLGTSYQCTYKTMKKRPDIFEPRRDGLIMRWRLLDAGN